MPIRTALWKVTAQPTQLLEAVLPSEKLLEDMIVAQPLLLSDAWMLIGRQEHTGQGGIIDLLAIAPDGSLVLIELKRDRTPRDVVAQALDLIPAELAAAFDNVVVVVADDPPADDPQLLGLYTGIPLTERDSSYAGVLPDQITIFRIPTLEMCDSIEEVIDEVQITVVHEIAHHFGIDDERLHELGYE